MRAKAIVIFPGGFGTLDEMFEALTLIQTGRMEQVPFLLFGEEFWRRIINWEALADAWARSLTRIWICSSSSKPPSRRWPRSTIGRTRAGSVERSPDADGRHLRRFRAGPYREDWLS